MKLFETTIGVERGPLDEARRYRPINYVFDTRNTLLDVSITDEMEPEIQQMWRANHSRVRVGLIAELGMEDAGAKLANYRMLGVAPFSIVAEHNPLLRQIRAAYAHGDFYPSLVGAAALGERILGNVVSSLKSDYVNHPKTTQLIRRGGHPDWMQAVRVLAGWDVINDGVASLFKALHRLRNAAVHYTALDVVSPWNALKAIHLIQDIVAEMFAPMGIAPRFMEGTPGGSYFARNAELEPIVRRLFLPHCALVSPHHCLESRGHGATERWDVFDDRDLDGHELTDSEFAERIDEGVRLATRERDRTRAS